MTVEIGTAISVTRADVEPMLWLAVVAAGLAVGLLALLVGFSKKVPPSPYQTFVAELSEFDLSQRKERK